MGEIFLWGLFWLLILVSFLGCFISKFPGPVLAFVAILMAKFFMQAGEVISWANIVIIAVLVIASFILNRFIPQWGKAKLTPYGKGANIGAIIGSILALILALGFAEIEPVGVALTVIILTFIILPFIFSFVFEYLQKKNLMEAAKSGGSATVVYVCTTFVKVITVAYSVYLLMFNN